MRSIYYVQAPAQFSSCVMLSSCDLTLPSSLASAPWLTVFKPACSWLDPLGLLPTPAPGGRGDGAGPTALHCVGKVVAVGRGFTLST